MIAQIALTDAQLAAAPFHLTETEISWVRERFERLTGQEKLAQLLLPMCRDLSASGIAEIGKRKFGGIHRFPSYEEEELRRSAIQLFEEADIPPLLTADIECSEKASVKAGTVFPNQMAVAATGDPQNAYRMGAIVAREAGYLGFGVSWTPVADLALNFRSNVVNTRTFSGDVNKTLSFLRAYLDGMRENGMEACIKHFPGDGLDDRDQHFATTHNTMTMDEWRKSFGVIYRTAIKKDVRLVMAGHITLADYTREMGDAARSPKIMPASLNADLLQGLLREELGYNGVIVSDATLMQGFNARGDRADLVPLCIESGCDILLFPRDLDEDLGYLRNGLENGKLSQQRVDQAVLRVLALKASMKLYRKQLPPPPQTERARLLGSEEHKVWARSVAEQSLTLIKDTQGLLPLSPDRHKRILLAETTDRQSPSAPLQDLIVAKLLEERGFQVTRLVHGQPINAGDHDIGLYLMAEEGLSGKEYLGPQWERLHGRFPASMQRLWHHMPTLYVSLGTPYLLYHMPECSTFINAYCAILPVQEALVDALTGKIPFAGISPIDATCGLSEAL